MIYDTHDMIICYFDDFNYLTVHSFIYSSIYRVEQMLTVTHSDCTQVNLTKTIKLTYDPKANTSFNSKLTNVHVDFNACQGINNHNNDL